MRAERPLSVLLEGVGDLAVDGDAGIPITGAVIDSRQVRPGMLFAALRGARRDGMDFVGAAIAAGAAAVLSSSPSPDGLGALSGRPVTWIRADDPRRALARIARNFHGRPDERLKVIGVTGTNGKTTVVSLLAEILRDAGAEPGLIGTVGYRIGGRMLPAERTTPEAPDLYRMLDEMAEGGAEHAVVEISSHGIALERVGGLGLAAAVFTNLTRDHLDFHGDMESYAATKRRMFSERLKPSGVAVAGIDDPRAGEMLDAAPADARRLTFGFDPAANVRIASYTSRPDGTAFRIRLPGGGDAPGETRLAGRPGVLNLAAATATAAGIGLDPARAVLAASRLAGVPGRLERVDRGQSFLVLVDYAHTDAALEAVLKTVREMEPRRVITVFGCGGDRDRSKRAPMGAAAMRNSDMVFLTSDNPRSEDPARILRDAEEGITSVEGSTGRYRVLEDRKEAIHAAIASAGQGDAVLIAGKGHETVQILADGTVPFDDRLVAAEALDVRIGRPA